MIKKLSVAALNGLVTREFDFHEGLNIFTGKNGSGKTSILKLIWYLISGNIEYAISEIEFQNAHLITDEYELKIINEIKETKKISTITFTSGETTATKIVFPSETPLAEINKINRLIFEKPTKSLFFPSFRRIEGSFAAREYGRTNRSSYESSSYEKLRDAMKEFSSKLTVRGHKFVSSISTDDIKEYTFQNVASISDNVDRKTQEYFIKIIDFIQNNEKETKKKNSSEEALQLIKNEIETYQKVRENIREPFIQFERLITEILQYKGIRFDEVSFGDRANAISSDRLSSGEKQMLSFLCYGTFYKNSIIFIDEPELSLHVDWQRSLFDILLKLNNNQYLIATHSPFIYSQYPANEFQINSDRG